MTTPTPPEQRSRNALGNISVLYVSALLRAAAAEGADADALAARFQLDRSALASPAARISIPRFMRLGHAAITDTGNRALGLRMGALSRPVDAGIAGLAGATAETAGDAMATLIRYALLTSQNSRGAPSLNPERREARFYSIRPYNGFNYFVVDSVLAAWTQFLRTVTGRYEVLENISIEYPSIGLDDQFEAWFRCPVHFGARSNHLTIKQSVWEQANQEAQPAMHEKLTQLCEREWQQLRRGWTTADRVKHLLTPLFQGETPSLETIATKLGMTPWTLQRHLAAEGSGFRELVDDTRRQLARDYIRETSASLAEIAWLLGFANPAAFHKAYRRWFGESPGEHRKILKTGSKNG
ncbi:MAG TPA: AraC family transcriptional regulator [Marinobacter sp.]|uniref:AraC family transcriptional regulator n=1 Tax=Marinobacter sp. TaxID=50741 RepID=UPI002D80414C|nr:AraC family transcriptional regulator [Marinobacter sp.]HET8801265.1 AraC family transcriptional regulator [Marinobacter sp.]